LKTTLRREEKAMKNEKGVTCISSPYFAGGGGWCDKLGLHDLQFFRYRVNTRGEKGPEFARFCVNRQKGTNFSLVSNSSGTV
jgi:hypothetical protein